MQKPGLSAQSGDVCDSEDERSVQAGCADGTGDDGKNAGSSSLGL